YQVHHAGRNRTAGHAVEGGFFGVLSDGQTAALLDVAEPDRAVRSGAGENDTNRSTVMSRGQGAQKMIDRCTLDAPLLELRQSQMGVDRIQVRVGGYDVDTIGHQSDGGGNLLDRHA